MLAASENSLKCLFFLGRRKRRESLSDDHHANSQDNVHNDIQDNVYDDVPDDNHYGRSVASVTFDTMFDHFHCNATFVFLQATVYTFQISSWYCGILNLK